MIDISINAEERVVPLPGRSATMELATEFANHVCTGDVIALTGDLGVGKTEFARSLIGARAQQEAVDIGHVPSPTYTLVQQYELSNGTIYHFDLYRLANPDEAWELGLEEAFVDGISIIEWAGRIEGFWPRNTIHIHLEFGKNDAARVAYIKRSS
ncbi:MAG: tRNA (adenosine(37)-N6)-threonylcarbamoyltransferase complex ATPase subunit type 1 TsaE [Pseudomonadota bacterium]|nr:tRNA (adenosine(37)-N6)-threonylcarbamoyltransferase complex ATPase subunit type 1 TsaE [Pseudomonadota bacterium]